MNLNSLFGRRVQADDLARETLSTLSRLDPHDARFDWLLEQWRGHLAHRNDIERQIAAAISRRRVIRRAAR